jgi:ATP-binding cassette subfamily G (WHITE) protein 2 (PDR)
MHPDIEKMGSEADKNGSETERDDDIDEKRKEEEVLQLARKYTAQSHSSVYNKNPFSAEEDSVLNPASPNFKPYAFAKSLLNLQARDPDKWKLRTAGFCYKNLNVYGFGSATDYQKSVGNVMFELVGLTKKLLGLSKPRKIDILQNLDGVVHHGEMLVVLGPPGR